MAEYTPSEAEFRTALHDMIANGSDPAPEDWTAERTAEFDRFLAHVRRDAARSALDGLAEHANRTANERRSPQAVNRWDDIWRETRKYRDTHYPETED